MRVCICGVYVYGKSNALNNFFSVNGIYLKFGMHIQTIYLNIYAKLQGNPSWNFEVIGFLVCGDP